VNAAEPRGDPMAQRTGLEIERISVDDRTVLVGKRSPTAFCLRQLFTLLLGAAAGAGGVLFAQYFLNEDLTTEIVHALQMAKRPRSSHLLPSGFNLTSNESSAITGSAFGDYSVGVTIGGQSFQLIVDTGSSVFAVASSTLDHCIPYYTGTCDGAAIPEQVYGSGSFSGTVCSGAPVTVGGLRAGEPAFAGITSQTGLLQSCSASIAGLANQGIAGMAYSGLTPQGLSLAPIFDSVVAASGIPDIFSMQCCGWTGTSAGVGTLTLGGIDSSQYSGSIQYTPITKREWYCVHLTAPVDDGLAHDNCGTIVDSGTSALVLTAATYTAVMAPINAAVAALPSQCVLSTNSATLPCIELVLEGGVILSIPPSIYYQPVGDAATNCHELVIQQSTSGLGDKNILGQVVMEAYYTIFDRASNRIGFATIAGCGREQPSTQCTN